MRSHEKAGVLVAPCILSPGFQAERKGDGHWGYPFIKMLMEYEMDIVPLYCPESSFEGYQMGMKRKKHGIDYYQTLTGYREYCLELAQRSAEIVEDMCAGGYNFICCIGVEHSPSCAVNYMYSHRGMIKQPGIFFEAFQEELVKKKIEIPRIGINRKYPKKALNMLEQLLFSYITREKEEAGEGDNFL